MTATLAPSEALTLAACTAADLMATNLVSLRADATVAEALRLFADKGISAAPVIDDAGHPIGVLSRSDLLVHHRETIATPSAEPAETPHVQAAYFQNATLEAAEIAPEAPAGRDVTVADLMTPAVFAVTTDTSARQVVAELVALHVHRLFVVDENGMLIGVISAMDVLRNLE